MGFAVSCNIFEKVSTFIHWLTAKQTDSSSLDHYLDDFTFAGKKDTDICATLMSTFEILFAELGIPLAHVKLVRPTTSLTFLGLAIDTVDTDVRIPYQKTVELRKALMYYVHHNKFTLRELQCLAGKLSCFVKPFGLVWPS